MIKKFLRFIFQVILVVAVVFFGYHYFTHQELRGCVSQPLEDLSKWQKKNNLTFNGAEVKDILSGIAVNVGKVASDSSEWAGKVLQRADEASGSENLSNKIVTQAQYLYCRDVVEKYQSQD